MRRNLNFTEPHRRYRMTLTVRLVSTKGQTARLRHLAWYRCPAFGIVHFVPPARTARLLRHATSWYPTQRHAPVISCRSSRGDSRANSTLHRQRRRKRSVLVASMDTIDGRESVDPCDAGQSRKDACRGGGACTATNVGVDAVEPLVEQVSTMLRESCGVCGGDQVHTADIRCSHTTFS